MRQEGREVWKERGIWVRLHGAILCAQTFTHHNINSCVYFSEKWEVISYPLLGIKSIRLRHERVDKVLQFSSPLISVPENEKNGILT